MAEFMHMIITTIQIFVCDYILFIIVDNFIKFLVRKGYCGRYWSWVVEAYLLLLLCWLIWDYHHVPLVLFTLFLLVIYTIYEEYWQAPRIRQEQYVDSVNMPSGSRTIQASADTRTGAVDPPLTNHTLNPVTLNQYSHLSPSLTRSPLDPISAISALSDEGAPTVDKGNSRPLAISKEDNHRMQLSSSQAHNRTLPSAGAGYYATPSVTRPHNITLPISKGDSGTQYFTEIPNRPQMFTQRHNRTTLFSLAQNQTPPFSEQSLETPQRSQEVNSICRKDTVPRVESLHPLGMLNEDQNVCYVNCVLQCLGHTPHLVDRIEEHECELGKLTTTSLLASLLDIWRMCLRKPTSKQMASAHGQGSHINPSYFCSLASQMISVVQRANNGANTEQQDASEFLIELVNVVHELCTCACVDHHSARVSNMLQRILTEHSDIDTDQHLLQRIHQYRLAYQQSSTDTATCTAHIVNIAQLTWLLYKSSNVSAIDDMFVGEQVDVYECLSCGHMKFTATTTNMLMLPVPIEQQQQQSGPVSLQHLISSSFSELMESCTACDNCSHRQQPHKKQSYVEYLPECLIINLLRSNYSNATGRAVKSHVGVDIPLHGLDMSSYSLFSGGGGGSVYSLYGLCIHQGAASSSGHYQAVVRYHRDRMWYVLDDTVVTRVGRDVDMASLLRHHHTTTNLYLLFYTVADGSDRLHS